MIIGQGVGFTPPVSIVEGFNPFRTKRGGEYFELAHEPSYTAASYTVSNTVNLMVHMWALQLLSKPCWDS